MAEVPVPECLLKPLYVPRKLLMGPGPSNASPRILAAGALPLLGHLHPEFIAIMDEVKKGIQYAFQTKNEVTLAVSGTGHAAMETAACNLIEPKDVVLSVCTGIWGERFADMAERQGAKVVKITKEQGQVFSNQELEQALRRIQPTVMFVTHGESSSATCQPVNDLGILCHKYGCILIVDCVASLGAVPMYMDKWGIDVLYTGAQKVLSVSPGASPISFSERAWKKTQSRTKRVTSFYFDMTGLANYWGCDGQPRKYHHTGPISSIYGLREGLATLAEEGLEQSWKRHAQCADMLYRGIEEMNLRFLVENKEFRLPTVTAVLVPAGVQWKNVSNYVMEKYRVELAGGLGLSAGKVWRIGLMGYNATPDNIRLLLRALREGITTEQTRIPSRL
ncbi:hypothetical protein LSH36_997g01019 [Paralvinella palmiformis]|uniref:Alanine--glyoxylate aminotransferase n=1 Tax=Paralvinella palmiformis TaxID=53620 RepID=A0AAD9MT63_9ANNE|nr:hypothetical protein LSH36_997g01019 [Paralvinella palmiformis]